MQDGAKTNAFCLWKVDLCCEFCVWSSKFSSYLNRRLLISHQLYYKIVLAIWEQQRVLETFLTIGHVLSWSREHSRLFPRHPKTRPRRYFLLATYLAVQYYVPYAQHFYNHTARRTATLPVSTISQLLVDLLGPPNGNTRTIACKQLAGVSRMTRRGLRWKKNDVRLLPMPSHLKFCLRSSTQWLYCPTWHSVDYEIDSLEGMWLDHNSLSEQD